MTDSEIDATVKRIQKEEQKRFALLRTVSQILNLSQDIEDIYDKVDYSGMRLDKMLVKAQEIQRLATEILPG